MTRHEPHKTGAISQLVDAELWGENGALLGVVEEVLIDLEEGRVAYLLAVDRHGERLRLPWCRIAVRHGRFTLRRYDPNSDTR